MVAIVISVGLMIFNANKVSTLFTHKIQLMKKGKNDDDSGENTLGIALVFGSLVFDGLTQTQTDKNHKESKRDFAYPNMFTNNLLGLVLSTSIYLYGVTMMGDDTHVRIL